MDIDKFLDGNLKPEKGMVIKDQDLDKVYWYVKNSILEKKRVESFWNTSLITLEEQTQKIKDMQNQMIKHEKMASLGRLVAGIAHELNTPLGVAYSDSIFLKEVIQKFSDDFNNNMLSKQSFLKATKKIKDTSDNIELSLARAGKIVNDFKNISVDQTSEHKRVFKIIEYTNKIISSLSSELNSIPVEILNDQEIELDSYPGAYSQILSNLVINSCRHGFDENSKEPRITIRFIKTVTQLKIEYRDNGKGIVKENIARIFDPFFTTKIGQGGSGLGLNLVQNIIEKTFSGSISCESEIDDGVKFTILLQNI